MLSIEEIYMERAGCDVASAAALVAYDLMRGDAASFKAGYTFANAVDAACELYGITKPVRVAIVAEKLHEALV